jgi:hypothetical protein
MAYTNLSTRSTGYLVTTTNWNEIINNFLFIATAAGLLKHEVGGIEADISAITTGGIVRGASSGVMSILAGFLDGSDRVKHEYGGIEADISGVVAGGLLKGSGTGTIGILARGSALQHLRVNAGGSDLEFADPTSSAVATGTYTGDGATSKSITGLGFTPKYVKIWHIDTGATHRVTVLEATASIMALDGSDKLSVSTSGSHSSSPTTQVGAIIAFGSGTFTVDDNGSDAHPNKSSEDYHYLAIG